MKRFPAIAIVEFHRISAGMYATDAMVKKAPIAVLKCGVISQGRYLALIGGSTAAVDESYAEGLSSGGDDVMDRVLLPDVHPQLHDALLGLRAPGRAGAMAIIETPTVSCNVRAAEMALKGTPVDLLEIRLADALLCGKGVSIYRGALYDIQAAVDIAVPFLRKTGVDVACRVIPSPHESFARQVDANTNFLGGEVTEMPGEAG